MISYAVHILKVFVGRTLFQKLNPQKTIMSMIKKLPDAKYKISEINIILNAIHYCQ